MLKKIFLVAILIFIKSPSWCASSPYYGTTISTAAGTAAQHLSGTFGIAASSTTPTDYNIYMDGTTGEATLSSTITAAGANIHANASNNFLMLEKPENRTFNVGYDSRTFNSATNRKALKILSDSGVGMEGTWLDDYGFWHVGDMESHFPNLWVSASTGPAVRIYGDILVGDLVYFGATSDAGLEVLQVGKRETGAYESGTYFMTAQHLNSDYRGGAYIYLGPNNANQGNERGNLRLVAFSSSTTNGTENSIYFSHRTGVDTVGDIGRFDEDGNFYVNQGIITSTATTTSTATLAALSVSGATSFSKNPTYIIKQSSATATYFSNSGTQASAGTCITGSTLTIDTDGTYNVRAQAQIYSELTASVGQECHASLVVDGSTITTSDPAAPLLSIMRTTVGSVSHKQNMSIDYIKTGLSAGSHTFCLTYYVTNGYTCTLYVPQFSIKLEAP